MAVASMCEAEWRRRSISVIVARCSKVFRSSFIKAVEINHEAHEGHLPRGANRQAPVSLSRSASAAFCDACDENIGRSPASHECRNGGAIGNRRKRLVIAFAAVAAALSFQRMRIVAQYVLLAAMA